VCDINANIKLALQCHIWKKQPRSPHRTG